MIINNAGYRLSLRLKCRGVELLLIHSDILGNEVSENRKRHTNLKLVKYSQYLWKHKIITAKSIADKIDVGIVLLPVTDKDNQALEKILAVGVFEKPILKLSIYKNRRGRYKGLYLWCKGNLGRCRVEPMFATTYNYELVEIKDLKIDVEPRSAF